MQRDWKKAYKALDESRPITEFDVSFRLEDAQELSMGLDLLPKNPVGLTIGSHLGASDFFMCTYRPDLTLYSLDCEPLPKWILNMRGLNAIPLKGMSDSYPWDKPLDILFIDGDHSSVWVRNDITKFGPFVRPGGIICGHDYDIETVKVMVDELMILADKLAAKHSWVYKL